MNNLSDLLLSRQSVRKYNPNRKVERKDILECLEAARIAPSACNSQPWKYIVVDDTELLEKLAKETYGPLMKFNKFVLDAPVIIVIVMEKPNFNSQVGTFVKNIDYPLIDVGISAIQFCLKATELGLGTCMLGWFNEKPIKALLKIPKKNKIGLLISMGYATEDYKIREKQRREINQMSKFNEY